MRPSPLKHCSSCRTPCWRPALPPPPLLQAVSINLSPNTVGQVTMSLMVNPPQEGDESHPLWKQEHDEGLASLRWVGVRAWVGAAWLAGLGALRSWAHISPAYLECCLPGG
jgi:hypothetical protein